MWSLDREASFRLPGTRPAQWRMRTKGQTTESVKSHDCVLNLNRKKRKTYLRRLIEGVLWTNVLALVDGQFAVLLARIVRLSDAFLVTTASSTSATTAAT